MRNDVGSDQMGIEPDNEKARICLNKIGLFPDNQMVSYVSVGYIYVHFKLTLGTLSSKHMQLVIFHQFFVEHCSLILDWRTVGSLTALPVFSLFMKNFLTHFLLSSVNSVL